MFGIEWHKANPNQQNKDQSGPNNATKQHETTQAQATRSKTKPHAPWGNKNKLKQPRFPEQSGATQKHARQTKYTKTEPNQTKRQPSGKPEVRSLCQATLGIKVALPFHP